ncbi:UNVERIFIED_CONTAM: hypothetical protein Sangu_0737100 [Sesamum angustifolium]|uniref:Uncharacterized protein n=1 Tax=Sesamum angustifolium TaxID=2727405 RepID=A0AAW2PRH4_9LAMI
MSAGRIFWRKDGNETLSDVLSINIASGKIDENSTVEENSLAEGRFPKSVSSSCLRSTDTLHETQLRPNFLDFPVLDFGAVYGMRRAFSDGDIKVDETEKCLDVSGFFDRIGRVIDF